MADKKQVVTLEDIRDAKGDLLTLKGDLLDVLDQGPGWYRVCIAQASNRIMTVTTEEVCLLTGGRIDFYREKDQP